MSFEWLRIYFVFFMPQEVFYLSFLQYKSFLHDTLFLTAPYRKGQSEHLSYRYAISRIREAAWPYNPNTLSFSLGIYDRRRVFWEWNEIACPVFRVILAYNEHLMHISSLFLPFCFLLKPHSHFLYLFLMDYNTFRHCTVAILNVFF